MSDSGFNVYIKYTDEDDEVLYMSNFPAERVFTGNFDIDYSFNFVHNEKGYYLNKVRIDLDRRLLTYFLSRLGN